MGKNLDKKFKIFVIIALVILTMVASTAVFLVITTRSTAGGQGSVENQIDRKNLEIIYMDEPLNANLKLGEDQIPHIIRLSIGVQIDKKNNDYKNFLVEFGKNQIIIRDSIIETVRAKTYEEMMSETAQNDLSKQIMTSINELLDTKIVQDIYFKDFFVQ